VRARAARWLQWPMLRVLARVLVALGIGVATAVLL
jgi:hypothetical protein